MLYSTIQLHYLSQKWTLWSKYGMCQCIAADMASTCLHLVTVTLEVEAVIVVKKIILVSWNLEIQNLYAIMDQTVVII